MTHTTMSAREGSLSVLRRHLREYGLRDTAENLAARFLTRACSSGFHKREHPSIEALFKSGTLYWTGDDLFCAAFVPRPSDYQCWISEYRKLHHELNERYRECRLTMPLDYAIEEDSSLFIYLLVRLLKPTIVLETGVANGQSSFFILSAILANGIGQLNSVDISPEVGGILTDKEKNNWKLHLLDTAHLKRSFQSLLDEILPIGLFLHDSDHSYQWQAFEFASVVKHMCQGAVIAADDVNSSYAFIDFCQGLKVCPYYLVDQRKVFGCATKINGLPPLI